MIRTLIIAVLLAACLPPVEEENDAVPVDASVDAGIAWSMHLGGPYAGGLGQNMGCSMNGDWLNIDIDISANNVPHLPKRPDLRCYLETGEGLLRIHCRNNTGFFTYDDFTFKLRKNEQIGLFVWWKDGDGAMNCVHVFWVTEIDIWPKNW
jgi:hypothetical protein